MRASLACCLLLACAAPPEPAGAPGATPPVGSGVSIEVPPPPPAPEIPTARTAFYARVFPGAARFEARPFPKEMLLSADKGNDTYVRALGVDGRLLGFLRDFTGPVIPGRRENPYPIAVLFAFAPDLSLKTIVPSEPMRKNAEVALAPAELERLIALARTPPAALAEYPRTSDVVDGTTEATRDALRGAVVPGAAYTTHRVVGLTASSRELIEKAPSVWDRKRLQQVVSTRAGDPALAHALAQLLPTLEAPSNRPTVYQMMSHSYAVGLLEGGGQPDRTVETLLLNPPLAAADANTEIARACYDLARRSLRPALVKQCVTRLTSPSRNPGDPAAVARLRGTHLFAEGDKRAALPALRLATETYDHLRDPLLHLRLVLATLAAGKPKEACPTAKKLYRDHPLLPDIEKALRACGSDSGAVRELIGSLRAKQKAELLASRHSGSEPAPTLSLENERFETVELNPAAPNTITVLVFFSTWCPHCAAELPRVNGFVREVQASPELRERVRVFGIRTSVEKERIPYDQFLASVKPGFPIYTDAALSLVFGQFVRTQGLQPELPTLAVLDSKGVLRFVLESGDYRDTGRELMWAVEALLP